MIGVAGLATYGKIPFISLFSMFLLGGCYEQIRVSTPKWMDRGMK